MGVTKKPFRFGVVTTPHGGSQSWLATARRAADLGYTSLLMPDGLQLPAPMPSLAMAAAVADIRVGTWVLAAPLRPARLAAWEAHTMTTLTDGRFELGIGTGRPVVEQWTREMELPYGSAPQRLARVRQVIETLRDLDGTDRHTPIVMAAAGPRALQLAAELADVVTVAAGALTPRQQVADLLRQVRDHAGSRADQLEFVTSLFAVGNELPPHAQRYIGADLATLQAAESLALVQGSTRDMADEFERRRDSLGTSYVTVNAEYLEQFAPVVEALTGR
jgi:probable F420-dependent oxidoreductase